VRPRRAELEAAPAEVAPLLLGARLTSTLGGARVSVRLTEVEAYGGLGEDPGSHAHRRRTGRNAEMFGGAGHAYVYFTYGMHWCLNVVAHLPDSAGAVLLRAGEVLAGLPVARQRRPTARGDRDLARGPARLATALGVTGAAGGLDLLDATGPLRLEGPLGTVGAAVRVGPRTGVAGAGASTPWRFWVADDPSVSVHRAKK